MQYVRTVTLPNQHANVKACSDVSRTYGAQLSKPLVCQDNWYSGSVVLDKMDILCVISKYIK